MGYDLHISRTSDWVDSAKTPVTKPEVDALIAADPELGWSTTDYVGMRDDQGVVTNYYLIQWRGVSCFWWYRDQIECKNPDDAQQLKLAQMARKLNAYCSGDDGERYEIKKNLFGREKLVVIPNE